MKAIGRRRKLFLENETKISQAACMDVQSNQSISDEIQKNRFCDWMFRHPYTMYAAYKIIISTFPTMNPSLQAIPAFNCRSLIKLLI